MHYIYSMNRIYILFIFFVASGNLSATIFENTPYKKITPDSILIEAIPYCKYGTYGRTIIKNLRTEKLLYELNFYDDPNTVYSYCGNYRVETSHGLRFYFQDVLLKRYSYDSLFPSDILDSMTRFNPWFSDNPSFEDAFIHNDIFYGLTKINKLYKIPIKRKKLYNPMVIDTIIRENYNEFSSSIQKNEIIFDADYELPEIYIENTLLEDTIHEIIKWNIDPLYEENFHLSIVLKFEDCKPQIVSMQAYKRGFFLFIHESFWLDNRPEDFPFFAQLQGLLSNMTFNCKYLNCDNIWAESFSIEIN
jgi:hypothetical protein